MANSTPEERLAVVPRIDRIISSMLRQAGDYPYGVGDDRVADADGLAGSGNGGVGDGVPKAGARQLEDIGSGGDSADLETAIAVSEGGLAGLSADLNESTGKRLACGRVANDALNGDERRGVWRRGVCRGHFVRDLGRGGLILLRGSLCREGECCREACDGGAPDGPAEMESR